MADGTIELHLDPASSDFDPGDARWARDVNQLVAALTEDLGRAVVVRSEPAPLAKGLSGILLALGSAGALTTAVELIRLWLRADHTRSVRLSWDEEGRVREAELTGPNLDDQALDALLARLARGVDGAD